MKKSVSLFVVGAQKSATTSLFDCLNRHDAISGSLPKEPQFFSKVKRWQSEILDYHKLFPDNGNLLMDGSTTYSMCEQYPHTVENIWQYNPDAKIIYLIRDPISRIESHFRHRVLKNGTRYRSIDAEVKSDRAYLANSLYGRQISKYSERFSRDQILIVGFDEFVNNTDFVLVKILNFLGLEGNRIGSLISKGGSNVSGQRRRVRRIPGLRSALNAASFVSPVLPEYSKKLLAPLVFGRTGSSQVLSESVVNDFRAELLEDARILEPFLDGEMASTASWRIWR